MPRINVYLPKDLAAELKEVDLNVSAIVQEALRDAIDLEKNREFWDEIARQPTRPGVTDEDVVKAVHEAREEFGRYSDGRPFGT